MARKSVSQWFERICNTIYAASVKEDIPKGLRSHVFAMRVTGIWSTPDDSPWYKCLTFTIFFSQLILSPVSMLIVVLYASSIQEAVNYSMLPVPCWSISIKSFILYWQRENVLEIFRVHERLLRRDSSNAIRHGQIAPIYFYIHVIFTSLFCMSWIAAVLQSYFSQPDEAFMPSTAPLPYAFTETRTVYLTVFTYQAMSLIFVVIWGAMEVTFHIALINMTCTHVSQLKLRLESLGTNFDNAVVDKDFEFYKELVECCKQYADCLR